MKNLGYIVGVLLVLLIFGFGGAALVTYAIGLFFVFPLTVMNILKVWFALVVFNLAVAGGLRL